MSLLSLHIERKDGGCPFGNEELNLTIDEKECLWIRGPSGIGKTSIVNHLLHLRDLPGSVVKAEWGEGVSKDERIGILFQQGVLVDTLNVYENIALSLKSSGRKAECSRIYELLKMVGLDEATGAKMPNQLSGGMLRRAALAQILAQEKKIIVLDEPFVGLDIPTAEGIVKQLNELKASGWSFIVISHQDELVKPLADKEINLVANSSEESLETCRIKRGRWKFTYRFLQKLGDYFLVSLPLIICAFLAAGFAISMLFADVLNNMGIAEFVNKFEAKLPYFFRLFADSKIQELMTHYLPMIKEKVYVTGLAKTFILELGPLLTALLLAGRIGGSYAGLVSMMEATRQNDLLRVLGKSPIRWTLLPCCIAGLIAAPLLTFIGTVVSLWSGSVVAQIVSPPILGEGVAIYWKGVEEVFYNLKEPFWSRGLVVNVYHSITYIIVIFFVAEVMSRFRRILPVRKVPSVITWSVVIACLMIILIDWGYSNILVKAAESGGLLK
jgi:ABC-type transporter Mla maintaining outer membrane lipid asymmetry ATPase subunit MlaF